MTPDERKCQVKLVDNYYGDGVISYPVKLVYNMRFRANKDENENGKNIKQIHEGEHYLAN